MILYKKKLYPDSMTPTLFSVIFVTSILLITLSGMAHADLRDDILSLDKRWDQHIILKIGDEFLYRICQQGFTCYDIILKYTGTENNLLQFDGIIQERLGYHYRDGANYSRMGQVTGNVNQDNDKIKFIWGKDIAEKGITLTKNDKVISQDDIISDTIPSFEVIMDGKFSLHNSPDYTTNNEIKLLEKGLEFLYNGGILNSKFKSGKLGMYLSTLNVGDVHIYKICIDGENCYEYTMEYMRMDRLGLHYSMTVNILDWYDKDRLVGDAVTRLSSHGPIYDKRDMGNPNIHGRKTISLDENSQLKILIDNDWSAKSSPNYYTNHYLNSIENTLLFLGGKVRIGDGNLMELEPILETGREWTISENHKIRVSGEIKEYIYQNGTIEGDLFSVEYSVNEPAIDFIISPYIPFPVSATYVGEDNLPHRDPNNDSRYWFRLIDGPNVENYLLKQNSQVITTDNMNEPSMVSPTPTPPPPQPEPEPPVELESSVIGDIVGDLVDGFVDIIEDILGDDIPTSDIQPYGIEGVEHQIYIFDDGIIVNIWDAEERTYDVVLPKYLLNTNEWPPEMEIYVNDIPVSSEISWDDNSIILNISLEDGDHFMTVNIPDGIGCGGTARCITGVVSRIIDGDTIKVGEDTVRFSLASAPELDDPYGFGIKAKELLEAVCVEGSHAIVDEDDLQTEGSYGRIIAKVICGGIILNEFLLDEFEESYIITDFCQTSEFGKEHWAKRHGC